ncbi:thiamin pyrophosphokinase 1-like [Varroa destructor]|uniref:Thiamin pyrophosphokinase thiamin-binding domain-containing protein n=1 Tax=Varroa destructor TaxID=109461 RepID=A0A7M7KIV0_VARDE|nr:thiamin pyrophosphokinase 1-like [Varroa destructor]
MSAFLHRFGFLKIGSNRAFQAPAMTAVRQWNYQQWLDGQNCAVVILNQPLNVRQSEIISRLWRSARARVAVDGGSNCLLKELPQLTPDLITGDLDSVTNDVLQEYENRGVEIIRTADQEHTDFTKCLQVLYRRHPGLEIILAFCAMGGRLDQMMANINTLYQSVDFTHADVVIHTGTEVCWVLRKGTHRIMTPQGVRGGYCGIIAVGSPVRATSKGLKWNLNSTELAFRRLVSTSNSITSDEVEIEVTDDVLWTMTLS